VKIWPIPARRSGACDDAVPLLLTEALIAVPVAAAPVVLQVLERVLVPGPPGIEVLKKLSVQVLAVLGVTAAGMRVRRDDRVVVCRSHGAHLSTQSMIRSISIALSFT
jgi:hypothetical protein